MEWIKRLLGIRPKRTKRLLSGFWWNRPGCIPLAAGRGWNIEIVGESFFQANISKIVGGKTAYGATFDVVAQLAFVEDNQSDPNAVAVMIDARPVGFMPREDAPTIRAEMLAINPHDRPVTCKARIVGGWLREDSEGSFGVKLSLSRPLMALKG